MKSSRNTSILCEKCSKTWNFALILIRAKSAWNFRIVFMYVIVNLDQLHGAQYFDSFKNTTKMITSTVGRYPWICKTFSEKYFSRYQQKRYFRYPETLEWHEHKVEMRHEWCHLIDGVGRTFGTNGN